MENLNAQVQALNQYKISGGAAVYEDPSQAQAQEIKNKYNLKARKKWSCNTGISTYLKLRLDDTLCSTQITAHHYACHSKGDRITG